MLISQSFTHDEVTGFKFGYKMFGRPSMYSHVYFVDGLLIDTGHRRIRTALLNRTKSLDIDQIVITHHHEDHTGNVESFDDSLRGRIYASQQCCKIMKDPPGLSFVQQLSWGSRGAYEGLSPLAEILETEKYSFEIIPIPGHASDMIALYEPNRHWLFSADLYINSYIGYFMTSESVAQQIDSTRRILQLDFDVMFCAHNPQLTNAKAQLTKKLRFLESSFQNVEEQHRKGLSAPEIMREMKWKENTLIKALSGGLLSKQNMVESIIRDIEHSNQ